MRIYIAPMESGTREEQKYLMALVKTEFANAAYEVVDTLEESDYNVSLFVSSREPDPAGGLPNTAVLTLFDTISGQELVSLSRDYDKVSDMDTWNPRLIAQVRANTPVIKIPSGTEGSPAFRPRFYLGARAGGSLNISTFQTPGEFKTTTEKVEPYKGGTTQSFGGEAAVTVEFRPFRFLSFQAEAVFMYDAFNATRRTQNPDTRELVQETGAFQSVSLMFPLLVKVPVELGKFTLSPFAGAYYVTPLGPTNITFNDSAKTAAYGIDLPLGISLGIDAGLALKTGEIFAGLRFDQNIGMTIPLEGQKEPRYSRYKLGLSVGYKFFLGGKQRDSNAPGTEDGQPETEGEQPGTEDEQGAEGDEEAV
ncbi:MAG: PorT family protein [Treponema sp.]|nr:PorT family protein [Treponema sp.]